MLIYRLVTDRSLLYGGPKLQIPNREEREDCVKFYCMQMYVNVGESYKIHSLLSADIQHLYVVCIGMRSGYEICT